MKLKKSIKLEFLLAGLVILLFVGGFFFVVHEPEIEFSKPLSDADAQKSAETFKGALPPTADRPLATLIDKMVTTAEQEKILFDKPGNIYDTVFPEADFGVEGVVFALESGLPLAACQVSFKGQGLVTDQAGEFHFWLEEGIGRLSFSCTGFKTLEIRQFNLRSGGGLAHFDVYLNESGKPGKGRIEVNGVGGRVYDRESGAPLAGARIAVGAVWTVTDDAGFFELWGNDSGLVTMMVSASGHVSEMISGIDFENRNNPFFFEVSLERNQVGKGRLALVGIGARLSKSEEGYELVDLLHDSPAAREGLASGDRLVAVDSLAVDDFSLREVVELIRGQVGLPVTLMVERDGDFLEFICLRERVVY